MTVDAPPRERKPWLLGFLCLLVPALPAYVVVPGPLKGNGSPARIIALSLFALVILGFLTIRRASRTRQLSPGALIILAYFALWIATYGIGLSHIDGPLVEANKTRSLITLITHVGVALYALVRIRTTRERNFVLGALAIGLTFMCLVGILQGFTSIDVRMLFRPPGFAINTENLELAERSGAKRVVGTSQHAIEFSVLAAVTVPLTIYFARHARRRALRWSAAAACCIALAAMPAAISRSGVISLAVAMMIYMFAFKVRQIALAVTAAAVAVGAYLAVSPNVIRAVWETVTGSADDPSIRARTQDYATVSQILRDHPLFGLGLGGQPTLLDNEWLQTIVQGGAVGACAMLMLSAGAVFGIAAGLRSAVSPLDRELTYMLGAMLIAILASSTTFDLFFYQQASFVFFLTFGMVWSPFTVSVPEKTLTPIAVGTRSA